MLALPINLAFAGATAMPSDTDNTKTAPLPPDKSVTFSADLAADFAADMTKPWWQSKTIIAAITAALPAVAHLLGYDWAQVAPYSGDIMTCIGVVGAIAARMTATHTIK
ncbi:hypothetical protein [Methylovulum psychrotolerans]|uniref:Holin n=1 Tax=Methylovulum psychrotolerans TaxID=1704499 RepID=A0A1Z4C0H2_9GAMM|nr:hypothetical protein [Methylovulum psychrotolerans]ASF47013.1 hypothetical protein CEK71_13545 [Methylovulum psychrotolerans]